MPIKGGGVHPIAFAGKQPLVNVCLILKADGQLHSVDGQYEPISLIAPLNMPSITCLLIKKNESEDIARGVQGEAPWLSARYECYLIDGHN